MSEVQRHNGLDADPEGAFVYYDEYRALRDERDRLVLYLDAALDHAQQYNEGCLHCGEGEIIDGETTPEHQAECWWYRAKVAVPASLYEKGI